LNKHDITDRKIKDGDHMRLIIKIRIYLCKTLLLLLSVSILSGCISASSAKVSAEGFVNFTKQRSYNNNFSDVGSDD
jgi:hypothetical protein